MKLINKFSIQVIFHFNDVLLKNELNLLSQWSDDKKIPTKNQFNQPMAKE